jgi:branched-chain amino acid transport system permease protein
MKAIMEVFANRKYQHILGVIVIGCVLLFPIAFSEHIFTQLLLCTLGIYMIVNTGFDILFGFSGQISLGQAGFYAIGAYCSALLSKAGMPVFFSMIVAASIAALVGYFLALPCAKLMHHFLAMVTIGFGEIVRLLAVNCGWLTGGVDGITRIPPLRIFHYELTSYSAYLYFVLAMVLLALFVKLRIGNSRVGRAMLAIKDNQDASEAFGLKLSKYKATAFTIASFYAGFGGALYAHLIRFISPESFTADQSSMFLVMLLIGGMGTFLGPLIGSTLMLALSEFLQQFGQLQMMIYGLLIIVVLLVMPNGIAGTVKSKYYQVLSRLPARPVTDTNGR